MSILFRTFVVEIRNKSLTPKKQHTTMEKYFVHCTHKETKRTYLLGTTDTEIEATSIMEYAMKDDAKHGESDEYEYEITHK